jgi:hypothetical protein
MTAQEGGAVSRPFLRSQAPPALLTAPPYGAAPGPRLPPIQMDVPKNLPGDIVFLDENDEPVNICYDKVFKAVFTR